MDASCLGPNLHRVREVIHGGLKLSYHSTAGRTTPLRRDADDAGAPNAAAIACDRRHQTTHVCTPEMH
jgi:hypothetical protein